MLAPSPERLREAFNAVERHIEDRYRIPVGISDVIDPSTGDLDGREIKVDYDQEIMHALFIIAHLFGHTVQWNTSERAREIARMPVDEPDESMLAELEGYEREACSYSL